jgi:hypothetical protein
LNALAFTPIQLIFFQCGRFFSAAIAHVSKNTGALFGKFYGDAFPIPMVAPLQSLFYH